MTQFVSIIGSEKIVPVETFLEHIEQSGNFNEEKMTNTFDEVTARAQCYKTFYHGNLLPFHGHTVILCYKAILPW